MRGAHGHVAAGVLSLLIGGHSLAIDDPVVARLNGSDVKASEVRRLLEGLDPAARKRTTASSQALVELVRAELGRRAVLDEARREKWEQRAEIAAKIEQARSDVIVSTYLRSIAVPAVPSDEEVHRVYEANLSRFMQPRRYHLAQIYVALAAGATTAQTEAARLRAQDLAKKAKAPGADFAALARASSDDKASAAAGGDLGWLAETSLVGPVAAAVQGMSENEVSAPIQTADGWHIVREMGTKPAEPAPFETVKTALVASIEQQAAEKAAEAYVAKLLDKDKAAVNEIELAKLRESAGG